MANKPTVLVLGRRKTDNMPSLTRMLEILKPRTSDATPVGMNATVPGTCSVKVIDPRAGRDDDIGTHDVCPMTGTENCPSSQAEINRCGSC